MIQEQIADMNSDIALCMSLLNTVVSVLEDKGILEADDIVAAVNDI